MTTLPSSHPVRFLIAVVAAFAISFSLASVAAMTGLLPDSKVEPSTPQYFETLADHLHAANVIAPQSAAVEYAPSAQQSALVPQEAADNALVASAKLAASNGTLREPSI